MPLDLATHLKNLAEDGACFEPYVVRGGDPRVLVHVDGRLPVRSAARESRRLVDYWDRQPAEYRAFIGALAAELPPMEPACRIVVQLPARFEAGHLPLTLAMFAGQTDLEGRALPRDFFEVIVLDNRLGGEPPDGSREVVAGVCRSDEPAYRNVHYLEVVFDEAEPFPLTLSRRLLADIAVCRAIARPVYAAPLYFAPEDADDIWIDPCQLVTQVALLDDRPHLDAARGQQDRGPWIMASNDLLVTLRRSWNFSESMFARRSQWPGRNPGYNFNWNRIVTSGWNTVFSAEIYALMRGYTHDRRMGEDVDIGERISCVRGQVVGDRFVPQVGSTGRLSTRSEGSPRRWLLRVAEGAEPYDRRGNYANFFSREYESRSRAEPSESLLGRASHCAHLREENKALFEDVLSHDLAIHTRVLGDEDRASLQYRRVLGFLGLGAGDYTIQGGRVHIDRIRGLATRLEDFREANLRLPPASGWPRGQARDHRVTWRSCSPPGSVDHRFHGNPAPMHNGKHSDVYGFAREEIARQWPVYGAEEGAALERVLKSSRWCRIKESRWDEGEAGLFELEMKRYLSAPYFLAMANGTLAIELALSALGIGRGDEVLVPASTFFGTVTPVIRAGAIPVFVDIDPATFLIDPACLADRVTSRSRAVVAVHLGGLPADMDRVRSICRSRGLALIEDCAQATGSEWKGQRVGTLGDVGCFSFQQDKALQSGEGGGVTTPSGELAGRMFAFHQGFHMEGAPAQAKHEVSTNMRITPWQAAILRCQLSRLDEQIARREERFRYLASIMTDDDPLRPVEVPAGVTRWSIYNVPFRYRRDRTAGASRDDVLEMMQAAGLPASTGHTDPLYRRPVFVDNPINYRNDGCPMAERAADDEAIVVGQRFFLGPKTWMDEFASFVRSLRSAGRRQNNPIR